MARIASTSAASYGNAKTTTGSPEAATRSSTLGREGASCTPTTVATDAAASATSGYRGRHLGARRPMIAGTRETLFRSTSGALERVPDHARRRAWRLLEDV